MDPTPDDDRTAVPRYIVIPLRRGGITVLRHPHDAEAHGPLFALDEVLAVIEEQLERGLPVDVGRP